GSHVVAALIFSLLFFVISSSRVHYSDVWGHLRFGEYIVQNGRLPEHEMFSGDFADQSAPLRYFYWLSQAGAYLVFDLGRHLSAADAEHQLGGGLALLAATHALLVTLRFVVLFLAFRRVTGSHPLALLGLVLSLML